MNTPVNFELAKLLKEKGFDNPCENRYNELGELTATKLGMNTQPNNYSDSYSAPTIAEVVMWLYEKHGIWISVHEEGCRGCIGFDFNIVFVGDYEKTITTQEIQYKELGETVFNSPTEAYKAAIEYTLNNLI